MIRGSEKSKGGEVCEDSVSSSAFVERIACISSSGKNLDISSGISAHRVRSNDMMP
jgi:hypothetical protein